MTTHRPNHALQRTCAPPGTFHGCMNFGRFICAPYPARRTSLSLGRSAKAIAQRLRMGFYIASQISSSRDCRTKQSSRAYRCFRLSFPSHRRSRPGCLICERTSNRMLGFLPAIHIPRSIPVHLAVEQYSRHIVDRVLFSPNKALHTNPRPASPLQSHFEFPSFPFRSTSPPGADR